LPGEELIDRGITQACPLDRPDDRAIHKGDDALLGASGQEQPGGPTLALEDLHQGHEIHGLQLAAGQGWLLRRWRGRYLGVCLGLGRGSGPLENGEHSGLQLVGFNDGR
jgi:hypothetical protein